MSPADQLSRVTPYLGRLLTDDYIQEQIGQALAGLRQSSRRAQGRRASEALQDRRLRSQLSAAAGALTEAVRALNAPPPPERHPVRLGLMLAAAASGVALAWRQRASPGTAG